MTNQIELCADEFIVDTYGARNYMITAYGDDPDDIAVLGCLNVNDAAKEAFFSRYMANGAAFQTRVGNDYETAFNTLEIAFYEHDYKRPEDYGGIALGRTGYNPDHFARDGEISLEFTKGKYGIDIHAVQSGASVSIGTIGTNGVFWSKVSPLDYNYETQFVNVDLAKQCIKDQFNSYMKAYWQGKPCNVYEAARYFIVE